MIATSRWRLIHRPGIPLALTFLIAAALALALLPLPWLVVGVPGGIVLLLILRWPHLALYLIAFAIPFGSLFEINLGGITIGVTEGLIGLMIAAWLVRRAAMRELGWTWPQLSLPVLLFIGAGLLSLTHASGLTFAVKELLKWVEFLAVVVFVVHAVPQEHRTLIVVSLLLAGVAQAALGAYQFFTQSGPEFFILRGRYMRAYGTFEQPNPYAGYLGLIAPLAFALGTSIWGSAGPARMPWQKWLRWLALGSFAAVGMAIGMSWSRGAWLGFGAALSVVSVVRSRRGALIFGLVVLLIAIVGLLGGARLLPQIVLERLTSFVPALQAGDLSAAEITDDNYASLERLAHWQSALAMWRDYPWSGVGIGNYEVAYARYALPKWPMALGHAHNYYLNIAAEAGLIGLLAYLALWAAIFWQTWRAVRGAENVLAQALALGALGMLVHVSVHNVVDNLWVHNIYIHVAIVLGLIQQRPRGVDR